jgi:hypothetical protein
MKRFDLSWLQHANWKLWKNYTTQLIGGCTAAIAILGQGWGPIPPLAKEHPFINILGTIGLVATVISGFLASFHNVDGTPQSLPGPAVPQLTAPPKNEQ